MKPTVSQTYIRGAGEIHAMVCLLSYVWSSSPNIDASKGLESRLVSFTSAIIEGRVWDLAKASPKIISSSTVRAMSIGFPLLSSFLSTASAKSVLWRQKILKKCREDIYHFLNHENGQIAIYDAVNPTASGRRSLAKEFAKHDVEVSSQGHHDAAVSPIIDGPVDTFHRVGLH